jgi:hypothetical protein
VSQHHTAFSELNNIDGLEAHGENPDSEWRTGRIKDTCRNGVTQPIQDGNPDNRATFRDVPDRREAGESLIVSGFGNAVSACFY